MAVQQQQQQQQKVAISWTLNVTILRAENIISADYFSDADSYVTLRLPYTTLNTARTKVVPNNKNPEWNETFTFTIKEILQSSVELCLYDEDPMKYDNLIFSTEVDITSLTVGKKETREYITDPEGKIWIAFELLESEWGLETHKNAPLMKQAVSYWTLKVTILSANLHESEDYFSKSDCYVIITLPTATAKTCRTKTLPNTNSPTWNESFSFRVPKAVKNILEIKLYEENPMAPDDLISTLLLDVSTLIEGKKETKSFIIDAETKDRLLVEFELRKCEDPDCQYLSNGILMAAPLSALDLRVSKLLTNSRTREKVLKLRGAFEENQTLETTKLRYYINKDLETEVGVSSGDSVDSFETSVTLQPLTAKPDNKLSLLVDQEAVDLGVETHEGKAEFLAVRMDFDIPPEEKEFVKKRKVVVAQAIQKLLGLESEPQPEMVPTVAVVASGGGTRAMTGTLGSLKGLQEIGVLDAVSYITAVSGSTWALAALYQDNNWSQKDIDRFISSAKERMTKSILSVFTPEKMEYYNEEIQAKEKEGYIVSFIDMAGLILEELVFEKKIHFTLSEQKKAVNEGQNPLPIYNAVNMKDGLKGCECEAEWCEFTPYEVGLPKYGAFVDTEDFGSHFFLGHIIKKLSEVRLPYLMGIWSSVFSVNLTQLWILATGYKPSWSPWIGPDISKIEVETEPSTLDTYVINPIADVTSAMTDFFKNRPVIAESFNFMRGLVLHWNYSKSSNFLAQRDTHPDAFPNQMTPSDSTLCLVDAGHAINLGCVPVLRPQRNVDVIISLSYSWDKEHIFKVLELTAKYCKDHDISFPNVDFTCLEKEPQREAYVLEDKENPKAPIVVHFPLVNVTYKDFKEPGVKRETEKEIKAGQVDVKTSDSPYTTQNMTYSKEEYETLVSLTSYNIMNNKQSIIETLKKAMEKKASQIKK